MKKQATCAKCRKTFERDHWRINEDKPNYCSRQCACSVTGKKPTNSWKKGLPANDPKLVAATKKQKAVLKKKYANGEISPWNKGLTKGDDPRWAEAVRKQTILRNTDGEWKERWRAAMSKGQVKAHAAGKYPHTFTKIEQRTWEHLESLGFTVKPYQDRSDEDPEDTWYHQFPVDDVWVADFGRFKPKQVIECNGCYVHGHDLSKCQHQTAKYGWSKFSERNNKRDGKKYNHFQREGWRYAIVWECEAEDGDFHRIEKYLLADREETDMRERLQ